jgi:hypothetical protein
MSTPASVSALYQRLRQSVVDQSAPRGSNHSPVVTTPRSREAPSDTLERLRQIAARRESNGAQHGPSAPRRDPVAAAAASVPRAEATNDDGLTGAEVDCIRVAELRAKVMVAAGKPGSMSVLDKESTVKVFPHHVVFSRTDNTPVVEIVIAELFELTEDDARGALQFHLDRGQGRSVMIEVACSDPATLSLLYKLVCAKRNALETA